MPHVIEKFGKLGSTSLATELGGLLFAPGVLIQCLTASKDPSVFDMDMIQALTLRASEFSLKVYMNEIDKAIVENNLNGGIVGGYIDEEVYEFITRMLDSITLIPLHSEIEAQAYENSKQLSLYDSRRLESAFQHGISLVTCEPQGFTVCPDELDHIQKFGYADVSMGPSESDNGLAQSTVWVFSPKALSCLLRHSDSGHLKEVDRTELLSLVDFQTTSTGKGSTAKVKLRFKDEVVTGTADDPGAIDVLLRAIEQAVKPHIDLKESNVYLSISDTTNNNDFIRVDVRLHMSDHLFEATDTSLNILTSAVKAYLLAINTALKVLY